MATLNYFIKGKSNPKTIFLRFKQGSNTFDFTKSTGYLIDSENWNPKKKFIKTPITDAPLKKLDKNLRELKNYITNEFSSSQLHHINSEWLQHQIALFKGEVSTNSEKSDYVTEHVQNIIDTAHTRPNGKGGLGLSSSRVKSYGNLLQMFKRFQGKNNYRVKEIDTTFANKFLKWMLNESYSQSYSLKIISDLKTTCYDAGYYGIETNIQLKNIKAPNTKNDHIIYLTPEELQQIEDKELERDALINARRWLILGVHIGQRGKDLLNLNESNLTVRNNVEVIELTQAKGNKPVMIPLPQKAKDILVTGFPRKIHLATFNKHLKALCKVAEINTQTVGRKSIGKGDKRPQGTHPKHELISSHVCRRTFATNYYTILKTPLLMHITGHSTEKMLLNYIGKSSNDYIQQIADSYQLKEDKDNKKNKETTMRIVKKSM
jgi:integrase